MTEEKNTNVKMVSIFIALEYTASFSDTCVLGPHIHTNATVSKLLVLF